MDRFGSVWRERAAMASRRLASPLLRLVSQPRASSADRERGQGLAEYALILSLIAIVAIAALILLGGAISGLFWAPISEDFGNVLDIILP